MSPTHIHRHAQRKPLSWQTEQRTPNALQRGLYDFSYSNYR